MAPVKVVAIVSSSSFEEGRNDLLLIMNQGRQILEDGASCPEECPNGKISYYEGGWEYDQDAEPMDPKVTCRTVVDKQYNDVFPLAPSPGEVKGGYTRYECEQAAHTRELEDARDASDLIANTECKTGENKIFN